MAKLTLHGTPVQSIGELPAVGSILKNFTLVATDLSEKTLSDFEGRKKVISIFPSVDTGVCATSVRKFNEEATRLENTVIINVSRDLPFAMSRFCAAEGLENIETLSDFRGSFGEDFGLTFADGALKGLLSRAIIVVDENNKILHTEQVSEITEEPNYESALSVLK